MKKYVKPVAQMVQLNNLDIICTSEFLFPIIPLSNMDEPKENQDI